MVFSFIFQRVHVTVIATFATHAILSKLTTLNTLATLATFTTQVFPPKQLRHPCQPLHSANLSIFTTITILATFPTLAIPAIFANRLSRPTSVPFSYLGPWERGYSVATLTTLATLVSLLATFATLATSSP